jgi:Flp pilus assembly pilin Flp
MRNFRGVVHRLSRDEHGQDLIEYALLATFISLLALLGAGLLGTALNNWYGKVSDNVNTGASKAS